jgi:Opioid growth factor receptor (OGFr) conserved region
MDSNKFTSWIVPFYSGDGVDSEGRKLSEIWAWDFEELECAHDYIQWLFPLTEVSAFNSDAPLVNEEVVAAFAGDRQLRQNLLKSVTVMLKFYGWHGVVSEAEELLIEPASDRQARESEWICPCDHNYLRIHQNLEMFDGFWFRTTSIGFLCLFGADLSGTE